MLSVSQCAHVYCLSDVDAARFGTYVSARGDPHHLNVKDDWTSKAMSKTWINHDVVSANFLKNLQSIHHLLWHYEFMLVMDKRLRIVIKSPITLSKNTKFPQHIEDSIRQLPHGWQLLTITHKSDHDTIKVVILDQKPCSRPHVWAVFLMARQLRLHGQSVIQASIRNSQNLIG